jgi:peptide-methionine (S)-S-oxide reductase
MGKNIEVATLAGGCFWCVEAVFDELKGVESVESGYSGGKVPNPTYTQVCKGDTGHAEAVQISYDPTEISYHDLLTVFFAIHDPTTLNRQGADTGTQYRSAIFHHDERQKTVARQVIQEITEAKLWDDPIVTEVTAFNSFHPAEDYHQEYFTNNSTQPYCRAIIAPKVSKFRKQFTDRLKKR